MFSSWLVLVGEELLFGGPTSAAPELLGVLYCRGRGGREGRAGDSFTSGEGRMGLTGAQITAGAGARVGACGGAGVGACGGAGVGAGAGVWVGAGLGARVGSWVGA